MKVILTGATGMIGSLVLQHCLESERVQEVVSLLRRSSGQKHAKLKEVIVSDFTDYSDHQELFREVQLAFFCLGAYTGQVPDALFKTITVGYPLPFAKALEENSPGARICLLSGAGADRSEKSKVSFALYKGMAENALANLNLVLHSFRPAYIYPVEPRKEPNLGYRIVRFLYPLMKAMGPRYSISSIDLAEAMFKVGIEGTDKEVLENQDILACLSLQSGIDHLDEKR